MRRAMAFAPFLLIMTALSAASQERDAPVRKAGGGVLRGRVIAADTGRPVARAQITAVSASAGRGPAIASTDVSGSFQITDLGKDQYVVVASKAGAFLDTQYGQVHPDLPGKTVSVPESGETTIEIAMMRAGVIAGRVFDEAGDPLPNATIVAMPRQTSTAARQSTGFVMTGGTTVRLGTGDVRGGTNDRGEYRLFGLAPGDYLITAMIPPNKGELRRSTAIYFPGVTDPAAATRLEIGPGQEIGNVDFTIRFVPTLILSGMAVGPDDQPLSSGSISLYLPGVDGLRSLMQTTSIQRDGTFRLETLTGNYTLRARHQLRGAPGSSPYNGDLSLGIPLSVGETDISGLFLKLTYGAALKGRMIFEGSGAPPRSDQRFRVLVESGTPGAVVSAGRSEDDTFTLTGIEAGPRRLKIAAPPDWILKGAFVGGRDMSELPLEFRDGITVEDVSLVFTNLKSPLSITVQHATGDASAAVVVFPPDAAMWHAQSSRIQFLNAAKDPVILDTLPPGDYLVAAIADVAARSLAPGDVTLLERLRPFAEQIRVAEGVTSSIHVRPVALPR